MTADTFSQRFAWGGGVKSLRVNSRGGQAIVQFHGTVARTPAASQVFQIYYYYLLSVTVRFR